MNSASEFLKDMDCVEEKAEKKTPETKQFDHKLKTRNLNRDSINKKGVCRFI